MDDAAGTGVTDGESGVATAADAPVVLTDVAPLARYRHLGELARWSDVARPRARAVWVVAPQAAATQGPVIDGLPLPLGSPGQYVRLDLRRLSAADDATTPVTVAEKEVGA